MKKIISISIFLCLVVLQVYTQVSKGGLPSSYKNIMQQKVPIIEMPKLDILTIQNYDLNRKEYSKAYSFAYPFNVNITTDNAGVWDFLSNGESVWRVGIKSEGAYSLNLIFNNLHIPKGAELFIYNIERTYLLGAFTKENCSKSGNFAVSPIPGNELIVEYVVTDGVENINNFEIVQVAHDYKNIFTLLNHTKSGSGFSGVCNVNVNCPEGGLWQKEKNSVCRILINGIETCTGALINNTLNNATPYVLTANHCISSSSKASTAIYYFEYESPNCIGTVSSLDKSISGSILKATYSKLDFSLVELNSDIPQSFSPYFSGWNSIGTVPLSTTDIHHPMGDIKKISFDYNPPQSSNWPYSLEYDVNAFWKILEWDIGTTEAGSSGSPLYDENHRIVGDLTGGDANCTSSINDYFCKFSESWDKYQTFPEWNLKSWLDQTQTGLQIINGYDPYDEVASQCFTISNVEMYETKQLYKYEKDWGYWTGHNSDSISRFAEMFVDTLNDTISGVYLNVAKAIGTDSSFITLKIWNGHQFPEYEIFSKDIYLNSLTDSSRNYIDIGSMYMSKDTFFVGYEIYYYDSIDTFAVYHSADRGALGKNTFSLYKDTAWFSLSYLSIDDMSFSLEMEVISCGQLPVTQIRVPLIMQTNDVLIYPNPSSGVFNIKFDKGFDNKTDIRVYDITGKQVFAKQIFLFRSTNSINLSGLKSGVYFMNLNTENFNLTKMISLIK